MTRITNDLRDRMAELIAYASTSVEQKEIDKLSAALAKECAAAHYPKKVVEALSTLESNGFFNGGYSTSGKVKLVFSFHGQKVYLLAPDTFPRTASYPDKHETDEGRIARGKALCERIYLLDAARKNAYREAHSALKLLTTTKALRASWPEAIPFVESVLPAEGTAIAPIFDRSAVNAALNLA